MSSLKVYLTQYYIFYILGQKTDTNINASDNDPAKLCLLKNPNYELITKILEISPSQPSADSHNKLFPINKNGRRFHSEWYNKILPDEKSVENRNWLSYSITNDHIYCIDCMFFLLLITNRILHGQKMVSTHGLED